MVVEQGNNFLCDTGTLVYITSDKWMCCGYGHALRKYILDKTNPYLLVDFSGQRLFETATVETNILFFSKHGNKRFLGCVIVGESASDLSMQIHEKCVSLEFDAEEFWVIKSAQEQGVFKKIGRYGVPLKNWGVRINFGIKTGLDEAFLVDDIVRKKLISEDPVSKEVLKPIFRGKDICRYAPHDNEKWLIATLPAKQIEISEYPAIRKYLMSFGKRKLEQSGEKNIGGIKNNNARKKTSNKWFETQDQISFYKEFCKPKVMWKRIGSILRFCYSDQEVYGKDTTCMMTGERIKYLTAFLNSKMGAYLLKDSPRTGTGDLLVSVQAMEPLRVARPTNAEESAIVKLLDKILAAKKIDPTADTSALESEIDQLVYKLYGLTEEEIAVVEGRSGAVKNKSESDTPKENRSRRRGARAATAAAVAKVEDEEELE